MGRKSSLTPKQWQEVVKLLLPPHNKSARSLAKQFGTSEASIRRMFPSRRKDVKEVANQIIKAEDDFRNLPITSQIDALQLVDDIKRMRENIQSAGNDTALVSKMFAKAARDATSKIMFKAMDDDGETVNPERLADCTEEIAAVMKSTLVSNEASKISLKLMDIAARDQGADKGDRTIHLVNDPDEQ